MRSGWEASPGKLPEPMASGSAVCRYQYVRFGNPALWTSPTADRVGSGDRLVGETWAARAGITAPSGQPSAPRSELPLDPEWNRFVDWVLRRTGLHSGDYHPGPLARRLKSCLRALRVRTLAEAWLLLQQRPERIALALDALLIGVTDFFRDSDVFAYLDSQVLPGWATLGREVRVWSAGCSDGAELYSVALLLAARRLLDRARLWGSDCRAAAVLRAERGLFAARRVESVPPPLRDAWLVRQAGDQWQIHDAVRRAAAWDWADILTGAPPDPRPWDMILCRNVTIYLQPAVAERVWTRLVGALRVGGVLVVGKAERPRRPELVRLAPCVFQRRG